LQQSGDLLANELRMFVQTINYDSPRGGISILTEKGEMTLSSLVIQKARAKDTGVYQCSPSSAPAATVNIHVLEGRQFTWLSAS